MEEFVELDKTAFLILSFLLEHKALSPYDLARNFVSQYKNNILEANSTLRYLEKLNYISLKHNRDSLTMINIEHLGLTYITRLKTYIRRKGRNYLVDTLIKILLLIIGSIITLVIDHFDKIIMFLTARR